MAALAARGDGRDSVSDGGRMEAGTGALSGPLNSEERPLSGHCFLYISRRVPQSGEQHAAGRARGLPQPACLVPEPALGHCTPFRALHALTSMEQGPVVGPREEGKPGEPGFVYSRQVATRPVSAQAALPGVPRRAAATPVRSHAGGRGFVVARQTRGEQSPLSAPRWALRHESHEGPDLQGL